MILASAPWWFLVLTLAAAAAYGVAALGAARQQPPLVHRAVLVAWLLHAGLLGWGLWGNAARFGFAPALSFTAWLVVATHAVEVHLYPRLQPHWGWAAAGSLTVLLPLMFPGQPLHTATSPWLPLHWALGIASYGLFAVAVAHAWYMLRTEARIRLAANAEEGLPLLTLERLTFRFATAGFVLLSATLLAGLLFDEALYGVVWKWNHKTVFSVLAWGTFAVLLLGRHRLGWRGRTAARMLYTGAGLLLLAYVGSRFVMEVLLGRTP